MEMRDVPHPLAEGPTGPLKGVRIVDMTSVIFGAYATQMLADLGADVIKIEAPAGAPGGGGDIMRLAGTMPPGAPRELGPIFMTINRNKRAVLLDLQAQDDAAALRRLIETSDVFMASIRYDGLKRLGLDYEGVKAIKPDIIYVHGSGYGSGGPSAGEPAYDDLIQCASGMTDLLSRADGDPTPRLLPSVMADKVSGQFMAQAVLAALFHHSRTGEGQFVEVPMLECMTSFNLTEHLFGEVYDPPTGAVGYSRVTNTERKPFATKDGHIGLLPYTDEQWRRFLRVAGYEDAFGDDPRFIDYDARSRHPRELYALIGEIIAGRTTAQWLAVLKPQHIPVVQVRRLDELRDDPHLAAVDFFQRYEHPVAGAYFAMRSPVSYSATPANIYRHAPMMGEHNALLADLASPPQRSADEASPPDPSAATVQP
jgi:crotonobetainyl-CoA:carnitine CoA-transferase CaiB-like acyl-CoA transferase